MTALVCPLCEAFTAFTGAEVYLPEHLSEEPAYIPAIVKPYAIVRCQGCRGLFVAREEARQRWVAVYPIPRKTAPNEVPEPVKSEFEEASLCFAAGAYNACASMCGIALEHLWNEQAVSDIAELKDKGIISSRLYKRADEIRLWGNLVKHELLPESVTKANAEQLLGYLEILLNEVYVEPKRLDSLTKKREELKKKAQ
jgi:hypothetical protein